jgi:hypothetical protein
MGDAYTKVTGKRFTNLPHGARGSDAAPLSTFDAPYLLALSLAHISPIVDIECRRRHASKLKGHLGVTVPGSLAWGEVVKLLPVTYKLSGVSCCSGATNWLYAIIPTDVVDELCRNASFII